MPGSPSEGDRCLETLLRDGVAGLPEVFDTYRARLERMLQLRLTGPLAARSEPADVLQEAYLDATHKLEAYLHDPQVSVFVWLRGLVLDRLKKVQREHIGAQCRSVCREVRLPDDSSIAFAQRLVADGTSPSQAAAKAELRQRVTRALMRLKEEDREVILMRHFEGLSNREVAETFGLGISGATMRHGRALFRLKELLQAEFVDAG